ncbi:oligosaccharide flippase family protein, partial [Vibrio sp. 10N.222.55.F9]|uniref:oligosaccharide flippase family protein n=1 Tax=Vibrio sp. 10N.222.55.F9 TaxID=1884471 RepID=UPI001054D841
MSIIFQMLVLIVFARLLGPQIIGIIAIFSVFIVLSEVIVTGGLGSAIIQKTKISEDTLSTVFYTNLLVAIIMYIALIINMEYMLSFFNMLDYYNIGKLILLSIFINSFTVVPNSVLLKNLEFKKRSKASIFSIVISSILGVIACYLGYGIYSFVILNISRSLVFAVLLFLYSSWFPRFAFKLSELIELYSFSWKLIVASYISFFNDNAYVLFVGKYYNLSSVGYYNQAKKLSDVCSSTVSSVIQTTVFPYLSKNQAHGADLATDIHKIVKAISLITFPMCGLLYYYANDIVVFMLGKEWTQSAQLFSLFCLSLLFVPLSAANINLLNAKGRSDLYLKGDLIKLFLNMFNIFVLYLFSKDIHVL